MKDKNRVIDTDLFHIEKNYNKDGLFVCWGISVKGKDPSCKVLAKTIAEDASDDFLIGYATALWQLAEFDEV